MPNDKILAGPANSWVVVVPVGFRKTLTAKPTPTVFLAYCNNGRKELNQYILPIVYHNGAWFHIVSRRTGFYKKEPWSFIATFNTYDLKKTLKEPSPIRTLSSGPEAAKDQSELEREFVEKFDSKSVSYQDDTE